MWALRVLEFWNETFRNRNPVFPLFSCMETWSNCLRPSSSVEKRSNISWSVCVFKVQVKQTHKLHIKERVHLFQHLEALDNPLDGLLFQSWIFENKSSNALSPHVLQAPEWEMCQINSIASPSGQTWDQEDADCVSRHWCRSEHCHWCHCPESRWRRRHHTFMPCYGTNNKQNEQWLK